MSFFTALIGSKIAMGALAIGAVAVGGTAAVSYASTLPESSQQVTTSVTSTPTATQTDATDVTEVESAPSTDAPDSTPTSDPTAKAIGPDATGPAAFGLCTAFTHGGLATTSTASASLVTAAAGADNLTTYCDTVVTPGKAGSHRVESTDVSAPSVSDSTDSDASDAPAAPVRPTQAAKGVEHKKAGRP